MKIFIDCGTHLFQGFEQFIQKHNIDSEWKCFCFEANPFTYEKLLQNSRTEKHQLNKQLENLSKFNTINNQIGFIIGINKKINYKNKNDCFVLVDSPNNITFYPQDLHFCQNVDLGNNIKSLWSGTCVISYNNGSLYHKSLTQLNESQLKQEILQQYSRMVKVGGQLVYATCSVLPSENQNQVSTFLKSEAGTNFTLIKDKKILSHKTGYDGFYMALLERKA